MVEPPEVPDIPEFESSEPDPKSGSKDGMKFKDWWSVILSTLAFALSAITFYLSNVKEYDDFKMVLGGIIPSFTIDNASFTPTSSLTGTFINSGTRSIAVQDIALEISQRPDLTGDVSIDCFDTDATSKVRADEFELDIEPFVVKPQDVTIRPLRKFRNRGGENFTPEGTPVVRWASPHADVHPVLICLTVTFIMPDRAILSYSTELVLQKWPASSNFMPEGLDYLYQGAAPTVLLKEGSKWSLW